MQSYGRIDLNGVKYVVVEDGVGQWLALCVVWLGFVYRRLFFLLRLNSGWSK